VAHGRLDARSVLVGQDGAALITDWGTSPTATAAGDVRSWAALVELLAEAWCAEDEPAAAAFASAVRAAGGAKGLAGAVDELRELARTAERATLVEAAREYLAEVAPGERHPPPTKAAAAMAARSPTAQPPPVEDPATESPAPEWPAAEPPASLRGTTVALTEPPGLGGVQREAPRWRLVLLAALIVVTLVGAGVDLFLFVTRNTAATALKIQSVALWAQWDGSTCTLLGVITTNGAPGTVTYGWTGDIPAGPALTARATGEYHQIEVTRVWTGGATATMELGGEPATDHR
jgi:hypothetical protein